MSQFLIAISESKPVTRVPDITFVPVFEAQQVYADTALFHCIPDNMAWAVLDEVRDTTDAIFCDAACDLSQAENLSETSLGQLLGELIYSNIGLIGWYGSEFKDLDEIENIIELIELINRDLPVGSGELYFKYR